MWDLWALDSCPPLKDLSGPFKGPLNFKGPFKEGGPLKDPYSPPPLKDLWPLW